MCIKVLLFDSPFYLFSLLCNHYFQGGSSVMTTFRKEDHGFIKIFPEQYICAILKAMRSKALLRHHGSCELQSLSIF